HRNIVPSKISTPSAIFAFSLHDALAICLARIQELIPAKKIVHTTFEFTDIAGLVKGASKGEGLGNKFLENNRQTDAIVHVVRALDRKSTRLNSSHVSISYAVFC